jgi:hypothetical protein
VTLFERDNSFGEVFEVEMVVAETGKALLVKFEDGEERWVPKGVIQDESEVYSLASGAFGGVLVTTKWWARQAGIAS